MLTTAGFVALLALPLLFGNGAQEKRETYGKTSAQILAMGHDRWYDFYVKRAGETTFGMSQAETTYAGALAERSANYMKKLPAKRRQALQKRSTFLKGFDFAIYDVQARGGGSMWTLVAASNSVEREELIWRLVRLPQERPSRAGARFRRELAPAMRDLQALAVKIRQEPDSSYLDGEKGRAYAVAAVVGLQTQLQAFASGLGSGGTRAESLLVRYLRRRSEEAKEGPG